MAMKLTADAFLAVVRQSGLITPDTLQRALDELKERGGVDLDDSRVLAEQLIAKNLLTAWQADKLLRGKHKGFVLGKYRLQALLGRGGMSSVYLAEHIVMKRRVAIKVLPAKRVHDSSYLARFHREAQAVAQLDHPNIVRAYDVDHEVDAGTEIHFLVMEHVDGQSLHDLVVRNGLLGCLESADYIRQSADGLTHAHRAGMVHRDIKPGNLLVDNTGVVKILDLGLARFFDEQESASLTIAHEEKVLGTADYLAPEQAVDSHNIDLRADIYSLGCTFYFMLLGQPPFTEGTLAQRLMAHQMKEPLPIEAKRKDVPESLLVIIRKMMAKKPDERYQSAAEVSEALAAWLRDNEGRDFSQPSVADTSAAPVGLAPSSVQKPASAVGAGSPAPAAAQKPPSSIVPLAGDSDIQKKTITKKAPDPAQAETNAHSAQADTLKESASKPIPTTTPIPRPPSSKKLPATPAKPRSSKILKQPPGGKSPGSGVRVGQQTQKPATPGTSDSSPPSPNRPQPRPTGVRAPGGSSRGKQAVPSAASRSAIQRARPSVLEAEPIEEALPADAQSESSSIFDSLPGMQAITGSGIGRSGISGSSILRGGNRGRQPEKRGYGLTIAAIGGVIVLGALVYFAILGLKSETKQSGLARTGGASTPTQQIINVGASGGSKTIRAALDEVATKIVLGSAAAQTWTINVEGGRTYDEQIAIGNKYEFKLPRNVSLRLISTGTEPAVLQYKQEGPVLALANVEGMTIEGFKIDAAEKPVAVELHESLSGLRLRRLIIAGFTETGIHTAGVRGGNTEQAVVLDSCTFRETNENAAGIRISKASGIPSANIQIVGARFIGPMGVGINVEGDVRSLSVRESTFQQLGDAIRFVGANQEWVDIAITNNTLYECGRGLVIANALSDSSLDWGIRRNLFFNTKGPEVEVAEFSRERFSNMLWLARGGSGDAPPAHAGIIPQVADDTDAGRLAITEDALGGLEGNWTSRAQLDQHNASVDVFSHHGKWSGALLSFAGTDPLQDNYLAPKLTDTIDLNLPPRKLGAVGGLELKPYVGAVKPVR